MNDLFDLFSACILFLFLFLFLNFRFFKCGKKLRDAFSGMPGANSSNEEKSKRKELRLMTSLLHGRVIYRLKKNFFKRENPISHKQ